MEELGKMSLKRGKTLSLIEQLDPAVAGKTLPLLCCGQ